ncbi:MAG: ABC transporter permease [Phycisphaerae bacterium]|nr:ABC transporter permease [Gemmatimonadaceae bacterium]
MTRTPEGVSTLQPVAFRRLLRSAVGASTIGITSLRENMLRTVLSMLGVIIGVAALVSVVSLGDVMQGFVRGELERTTDLQMLIMSAQKSMIVDGERVPLHDYPVFAQRDMDDLAATLPLIRGAAIQLNSDALVGWPRAGTHRNTNIEAVSAGIEAFGTTKMAVGRLFSPSEVSHNANVIVLGYKLADELAAGRGASVMLDEYVRVRGRPRQVIGIFAEEKGERGYRARVPYSAAATVYAPNFSLKTPLILIKAQSVEAIAGTKLQIEDWLASRYRNWQNTVQIQTRERELEQTLEAFGIMKFFLGALAGISLLVGGIGIMNIMLANVTERTREIGVRKAIGARGQDIHVQFLTEAVAVSCFGSFLGVILGALITAGIVLGIRVWSQAESLAFAMAPQTVFMAALAAVTIGLLFGTYPARRAARLSPIDAIRHE